MERRYESISLSSSVASLAKDAWILSNFKVSISALENARPEQSLACSLTRDTVDCNAMYSGSFRSSRCFSGCEEDPIFG